MFRLSWLIEHMKEGEIARANYAQDERWFITRRYGFFWYCDENGNIYQKTSANDVVIVTLTPSNMGAWYEIVGLAE